MSKTKLAAAGILAAVAFTAIPPAHAQASPGCVSQYWLYGGLFGRGTTRTICDGPIRPDGSWMRAREFYDAARYVPMTCSWGTYGGSCTGGYWLNEFDVVDYYPVTPDTVLPDEPGHIDGETVA